MASYAPPMNNLTLFNPDQFMVDSSLLEFPIAQGSETFPNGLTTSTATVVGALTAGSASITGALTAGTFAPATINCNNIIGTTMTIQPSTQLNLADGLTSGSINIARQDATATTTTVNIATGNGQTGTVNIGTGTGTKTMGIGGTNTTLNLVGTAITASNLACNTFTTSTTSTNASLFGEASRGGNINIGIGTDRTGTINIGNGGGASATGGVSIQTNGTGTVTIGNSGSTTALVGATTINSTGTQTTTIGNSTGATTITNGLYAPKLTANYLTLSVPYIGASYFSSFSKATVADSTAYFPMNSTNNWNTYSGTSWDTNGGITLPIGIYNAYLGLNLDGSTTAITDMRLAFLISSSDPGSTEANWTGNLPYTFLTVASSPRNYTMYFHKTDSCDNSANDSEQFNISGCVYVDGSTVLYPCVRWNRGATNSTLRGTIIFTRIG